MASTTGGYVDDLVHFRMSCQIFTYVGIIYGVAYTLFNIIPILINQFKENRKSEAITE